MPKAIPPGTTFGFNPLDDSLSPFRKGKHAELDIEVSIGRLGSGAGSSSSLRVRSITALLGRLLLAGRDDAIDCSRDGIGGVRCRGEFCDAISCFNMLILMSGISTRSSSSSGLYVPCPFDMNDASPATFSDQVPSGSIVTCSTDDPVFLRMSFT